MSTVKNPLLIVKVNVSSGESGGYIRPTGVPNGEEIIANAPDIEQGGVVYKPIYYICAMDTFDSATFSKTGSGISTGADAYVFSDEPSTLYVGTSVSHTFDRSLDFATDEEWNCRYIIMYATAANKASTSGITVNLYKYRATFEMIGASGTIFSSSTALFGYSSSSSACKNIKYVDISNCGFYNNAIGDNFCNNCGGLIEIKLPESITKVDGSGFCQWCQSLTSLSLPNLTKVDGSGFCQQCQSLTSLSLPNLTTVDGRGFCQWCQSLTSLSLPNLTTVNGYFCYGCYSLTSLSLPALATVNGIYFCYGCYSLTSLSLPALATANGDSFCHDCTSLTSLSLPALATVNGIYFCYGCYSLSYMDLSAVTSLTDTDASNLNYCRYITLPTDFDIDAVNFTGYSGYTKSLDWLNNELPTKLEDNSGGTAKKMTLGAANIALITPEAAAIIAAKNWTIA